MNAAPADPGRPAVAEFPGSDAGEQLPRGARVTVRPIVAEILAELGDTMPDLVLLTADGKLLAARLAEAHPHRCIDVGIAEANLVGVAAGLARAGHRVVVATMAPFLVRRAAEQIRLDVCHPGLNVTLIGVGGGIGYGSLGPTHHVPEDLAVVSAMPGTRVYCPADHHDAAWAIREAVGHPGPAYVRIGARDDEVVHDGTEAFSADRPSTVGDPGDALVIATGAATAQALAAAEQANRAGLRTGVLALTCVTPFPVAQVRRAAQHIRMVVTVEEHHPVGGIGAATALALAGRWCGRLRILAVDGRPAPAAERDELFRFYGIDRQSIIRALLDTDLE